MRVLLVEDNPADAALVRKWLGPSTTLEWVESLGEAEAHLDASAVDVVLLDLNLPDSEGLATLTAITRRRVVSPVVVLTITDDDATGVQALRAGAEEFLGKNELNAATLRRTLRHAIERCELRRQMRTIAWHNMDATLVISNEGRVLFANPAAATLFERPISALEGHEIGVPSTGADTGRLEIQRASGSCEAELRWTRVDWVGGQARLASLRDVTALRRVTEIEGHLSLVLEQLPLTLWTVDADLRLGWSVSGKTGFLRRAKPRSKLADLLPPQAEILVEAHHSALSRGAAQLQFRWEDRTYTCFLRRIGSDPPGVVGMALDVTDQVRQTQRLDAMGQLSGGVAHDFNNMLSAIGGYAELAATHLGGDHPASKCLAQILLATERSAQITEQILAFTRKEPHAKAARVDLWTIVAETESLLARLLGEHVEVSCLKGRPAFTEIQRSQAQQVIVNLAVNARDAMPEGGLLTIRATRVDLDEDSDFPEVAPGSYAMLEITDTGSGLAPGTKARIFEPFFTTKDEGRGTGLGLATVSTIVRQNNGHIRVHSEVGQGTRFQVLFPSAVPPALAPEVDSEVPVVRRRNTETILVAEDEVLVRELMVEVLHSAGFNVVAAGNGEEALAAAADYAGEIALVISDLIMPKLGGVDFVRELTVARPGLKALFVSGYPEDVAPAAGGSISGGAFLEKPLTPSKLLSTVESLLSTND